MEKNTFVKKKLKKKYKNKKFRDNLIPIIILSFIFLVSFGIFIILKLNIIFKQKNQKEKIYKNDKNFEKDIANENIKKAIEQAFRSNITNLNKTGILNYKSYSQYLEDIILFLFLYDINIGFYIDVGANDPIIDSVTNFFYLRGWKGINIEPLDDKYILLKNNRTRDINLHMAAGRAKGNATLYIREGLTTIEKNYSGHGRPQKKVKVETMAYICKKYVPKNTTIEFCKIDVEGGERNVLLGYDFVNYRPKIICIESTYPLTMIPTQSLFEDVLFKNNYSFIYQYNVNRFYIDNKSHFANILKQRVILIDFFIEKYNELEKEKKNDY